MQLKHKIRDIIPEDRGKLLEILKKTGVFRKSEIDVALELIDIILERNNQRDYMIRIAEIDKIACGYVCFGPTPCTVATWDIYWMAVNPDLHGKGIGRTLLNEAERIIKENNGKLIVVETSSIEKYKNTRTFYENNGYNISARIPDFYDLNDDRIIYIKKIRFNK